MSKHAATRRSPWAPLLVCVVAGLLLLGSGAGVFAVLRAAATGTQSVGTGTLTLALAGNGAFGGPNGPITAAAPNDLVYRFVTVRNTGTIDGQNLTLSAAGSTGAAELLNGSTTGPDPVLRISVTACPGAWTPTGTEGACSGTASPPVSTTVRDLMAAPVPVVPGSFAAGATYNLRLGIRVADIGEVSTNGTPPPTTVQGKSASLLLTFAEDQRGTSVSTG